MSHHSSPAILCPMAIYEMIAKLSKRVNAHRRQNETRVPRNFRAVSVLLPLSGKISRPEVMNSSKNSEKVLLVSGHLLTV